MSVIEIFDLDEEQANHAAQTPAKPKKSRSRKTPAVNEASTTAMLAEALSMDATAGTAPAKKTARKPRAVGNTAPTDAAPADAEAPATSRGRSRSRTSRKKTEPVAAELAASGDALSTPAALSSTAVPAKRTGRSRKPTGKPEAVQASLLPLVQASSAQTPSVQPSLVQASLMQTFAEPEDSTSPLQAAAALDQAAIQTLSVQPEFEPARCEQPVMELSQPEPPLSAFPQVEFAPTENALVMSRSILPALSRVELPAVEAPPSLGGLEKIADAEDTEDVEDATDAENDADDADAGDSSEFSEDRPSRSRSRSARRRKAAARKRAEAAARSETPDAAESPEEDENVAVSENAAFAGAARAIPLGADSDPEHIIAVDMDGTAEVFRRTLDIHESSSMLDEMDGAEAFDDFADADGVFDDDADEPGEPGESGVVPARKRSRSRGRGRRKSRDACVADTELEAVKGAVDVDMDADMDMDEDFDEAPVEEHRHVDRKMLVSVLPGELVEVVMLEAGAVQEYYVEMEHQAKIRGNIYKGVISNIDVNLQAAFVNYGNIKNGFLQIDEVHPEYWLTHHDATKGHKYPPIQKVLKPGQEVLVQVVKEPNGAKGAFLTTWVSLAGRFLVLTPGQEQIGISRKVEDGEERNRLRELIKDLKPGEGLGAIVRTVSAGTSKTTLQKDLSFLKRVWKDIRKRAGTEKAPSLIYKEPGLATRSVRDYLSDDVSEVWVDDAETAEAIRDMTSLLFPRKADLLHLHQDGHKTLWEQFKVRKYLDQVHAREVILPSGGRLVFDQTEALMAIDINSGKSGGKTNFESMALRTNVEAAEMIAHQLRLRDVGGQVVIDFIEMRDQSHTREVEKIMRNAMKCDRARYDIGKMSSFGLMQIVRQRIGSSAISISQEACPHCQGTGLRRNMEWQSLQLLRDLKVQLRTASSTGQPEFTLSLEPELALYILNNKRERLCSLEKEHGVKLDVKVSVGGI